MPPEPPDFVTIKIPTRQVWKFRSSSTPAPVMSAKSFRGLPHYGPTRISYVPGAVGR